MQCDTVWRRRSLNSILINSVPGRAYYFTDNIILYILFVIAVRICYYLFLSIIRTIIWFPAFWFKSQVPHRAVCMFRCDVFSPVHRGITPSSDAVIDSTRNWFWGTTGWGRSGKEGVDDADRHNRNVMCCISTYYVGTSY